MVRTADRAQEPVMQGLHNLISTISADGAMLAMLQDDPRAFADRMGLGEAAAAALKSADTLVELDRDPIHRTTLTGGVTKCYARGRDFQDRVDVERLTKKDLLRILKLSLTDARFAAKVRSDIGL
jgi:hypothetical protein